ncbi:MAG: DUF370 domain-containing protein [Armatimonadota bacterium]|nr:DUF370 domain-containing protein [Armatimonadota bacterium]MDW8155660.1 DUF370 domain-containing protein [Armatimonadota bacterium]
MPPRRRLSGLYLHIGEDRVVRAADVVAILDVRLVRGSETNQLFFERAAAAGRVLGHNLAGARSLVVTVRGVYPSAISPTTLARRARLGLKSVL